MSLVDTLSLRLLDRSIRDFALTESGVEVGSDPGCDVVVHAAEMPSRALFIHAEGGVVYAYDLVLGPGLRRRVVMPLGESFPLGAGYSVARVRSKRSSRSGGVTERMKLGRQERAAMSLVNGSGSDARSFHIRDAPLSLGSATDNAIVLTDRAISRHHCRIEPGGGHVLVRDLGSTNGTWVNGFRAHRQCLRPGAVLRVGRTELRVASRVAKQERGSDPVVAAPSMLALMADVDRFAELPWPVLVVGETGVGKEHIARALHDRGPRRQGPFVPLNGGGLPRELVESELFGHEKGAFTGALRTHRGAFERACGGTLFLDEIAELPLELQTRLLRVLESWEVRRVGAESARRVDVRLICATHGDLRAQVRDGRFRADLFYRIHRLVLRVPPLRARTADIEPLARHFLERIRPEVGPRELGVGAVARLRGHPWPGNVRELRNVLELAAVECDGVSVDLAAIERSLRRTGESVSSRPPADLLRETLDHYGGNFSAAARALGIPRSTLRDRLNGENA